MSSTLQYMTLDVFTRQRFAGNQLAIVRIPEGTDLTQDQKQTLAREFNYSETVILRENPHAEKQPNPEWQVYIFTTDQELPFAGHPIIGTACYVFSSLYRALKGQVVKGTFITRSGPVGIEYDVDSAVATCSIPINIHLHSNPLPSSKITRLQPQLPQPSPLTGTLFSIVKGMTFALIQLPNLETLATLHPRQPKINAQLNEGWTPSFVATYWYVLLPSQNDGITRLRTRMIESEVGEDSASGSAACALATYLARKEGKEGRRVFEVTQGVEMGRRSEIGVEVVVGGEGEAERVWISGSAVRVMEGAVTL